MGKQTLAESDNGLSLSHSNITEAKLRNADASRNGETVVLILILTTRIYITYIWILLTNNQFIRSIYHKTLLTQSSNISFGYFIFMFIIIDFFTRLVVR